MIYLRNKLGFYRIRSRTALRNFWRFDLICFQSLAVTLADKWGFPPRFQYSILNSCSRYFLIGSVGMTAFCRPCLPVTSTSIGCLWFSWFLQHLRFIYQNRPCWEQLLSRPKKKRSRSVLAVNYWLVNVGAMLGPTIAYLCGIALATVCLYGVITKLFSMLIVNLLLYKK